MEKFAVIDTETNWHDEVMSIGMVIAEADTFNALEFKYYILTPEYMVGGMYSYALKIHRDLKCDTLECKRKQAISDLLSCLQKNQVEKIFAYNASFDYRHLPELNSFTWYDIMRLAAYRQYNNKIKEEDCCSTGRLRRNYGVESIKKLLTGLDGEQHNALSDAMDELFYVMKPLGYKVENYIPYIPQNNKDRKMKMNKVCKRLKLTVQDINKTYEIIQPTSEDLFLAVKLLTTNSSNYIIIEHTPILCNINFIKAAEYENGAVWVYWQIKDRQTNTFYNCRKKLSINKFWEFLTDFKNYKMPDISRFEIY